MFTLKKSIKITHFVLIVSCLNLLLFHLPFFKYALNNLTVNSISGIILIISLLVAVIVVNALVFYIFFLISRIFAKTLLVIFFILNAVSVYFISTYSVIIDETMIGNVINTKSSEAGSFFSFKLVLYVLILGVLPSIFIVYTKIIKLKLKKSLVHVGLTLLFVLLLVFANASNWLWIDKNSKTVGGLAMPWSYTVNLFRFYAHKSKQNEKEILLPNATLKDNKKTVVVLVIGESARSQNFSLYGYGKNTNPLLSVTPNVYHFNATSSATYTTAGVKSILEAFESNDLYEILPNYLYRNDIEVIWRTTNWGEPPVHIKNYQTEEQLRAECKGSNCNYDEVLLTNLKEQILASTKNKVLIILHTSTSHGPTYSKKYPPAFEIFKPVCNSVELGNCSQESLINAYDNTIVYTDYILKQVIENLKQLPDYKSSMIFVSDHGESLGEKNLYMHGLPKSIAPKEQYTIPFIVWSSENNIKTKDLNTTLTQGYVFHSVLNFLGVQTSTYNEELNIFK